MHKHRPTGIDAKKMREETDMGLLDSFFWGGGFEIVFMIMFFLITGMFVVMLIKGIGEWHKNNQSPRLSVDASVVSRRSSVSHHHHTNAGGYGAHTTTSTSYYVTFQVESGDRMELCVTGREYGMLAEGDYGKLSFQGTRYLGFERQE